MRIVIEVDGVAAIARLHVDGAPAACRRLVQALPISTTLRHSRWSGETTYTQLASLIDTALQRESSAVPAERPASIMCAATVHYGPARGNIGLPYGQAQSRAIGGANTWGVHLATIEGDLAPYLRALASVRRRGSVPVAIRLQEGS
jgi:Protein of unknown function (DUF3830)